MTLVMEIAAIFVFSALLIAAIELGLQVRLGVIEPVRIKRKKKGVENEVRTDKRAS